MQRVISCLTLALLAACGASRAGSEQTSARSSPHASDDDVFGPAPDAGSSHEDAAALVAESLAASERARAAAEAPERERMAQCLDAGLSIRPRDPPRGVRSDSELGGPTVPYDPCGPTNFDRGAAAASLGGISVADCASKKGPRGSGHARITFGSNGAVVSVEMDAPFARTPVGQCIADKLRLAHVPSFVGPPVTVGKAFSLY
jgi:hypothetical protein